MALNGWRRARAGALIHHAATAGVFVGAAGVLAVAVGATSVWLGLMTPVIALVETGLLAAHLVMARTQASRRAQTTAVLAAFVICVGAAGLGTDVVRESGGTIIWVIIARALFLPFTLAVIRRTVYIARRGYAPGAWQIPEPD